ncbi:MAG: ABC transporter permease subunit [Planctomycetes bacterium]|nr:ABC transporter permease subunit [Planctomycetota bacterium]
MIARLELLRLWRSRRPWIAAGALVLFLGLMLVGFYTYAQSKTRGAVRFEYTFENESYFNGLTFALYAFYFGFVLLLPVFVATEGGAQIAGDTASGNLGLLLARPVSKTRLFFTKLGLAALFCVLLVGLFLGVSLLVGLVAVGWGELALYPGVLQMTDRPQHLGQQEALARFLIAWPAASASLLCPLAFSLWISTWAKSAVNAVGLSVSLYLVLYVISEVHFFQDLRPWLFTSYATWWRALFRERIDWNAALHDGARVLGFATLFTALALRRFRTREEHG